MKRYPSPALRLGSAALVLATTTTFFAAGCGASSPTTGLGETKVTSSVPQSPPQNLGDAEAQLASAEQNVFGALGLDKRDGLGPFAQPPGQALQQGAASESSPPPPPADSVRPSKDSEARATGGAATPAPAGDAASQSSSPCMTACRALASMDRAAAHICDLAGYDDSRCANARERVRMATERVRQSCSDCGG